MPEPSDLRRILEIVTKRINGTISSAEKQELNDWIYAESGINTAIYEVLINRLHGEGLKMVGMALQEKYDI
jgi:hypothetical protein